MSMYDIVLGDGSQDLRGKLLVPLIGSPVIARFRDAWVETSADGPVIAVYTRQGGGNRECYCKDTPDREHVPAQCYAACNEALQANPLYLRDADDSFDSTYATFYFRVPEDWQDVVAQFAVEPVDTGARWQEAMERVQRGEFRPSEVAAMDQIASGIKDALSGDGPSVIEV